MSRETVLIIDDEPAIRRILKMSLESNGFDILEAPSGALGIKKAMSVNPSLIILDLGLPDMNGLEVLKKLREWADTPVIVLTVTEDDATKVSLLDAGADDYMTKPFSAPELLARMRVALRHKSQGEVSPVFESNDLKVDLVGRVVSVKGTPVKLTATEFEFFRILVKNAGRVVTQDLLLTQVWGPHFKEQTHYVRIYVGQLRKKIEENPSLPKHILTEPGVGYRLI